MPAGAWSAGQSGKGKGRRATLTAVRGREVVACVERGGKRGGGHSRAKPTGEGGQTPPRGRPRPPRCRGGWCGSLGRGVVLRRSGVVPRVRVSLPASSHHPTTVAYSSGRAGGHDNGPGGWRRAARRARTRRLAATCCPPPLREPPPPPRPSWRGGPADCHYCHCHRKRGHDNRRRRRGQYRCCAPAPGGTPALRRPRMGGTTAPQTRGKREGCCQRVKRLLGSSTAFTADVWVAAARPPREGASSKFCRILSLTVSSISVKLNK